MADRIENHFCGMLIIRKEPGYTSSDVVAKLRGILHMRRIGHTGTLDPMAEGVLPVCLGNATKLAELISDRDKEYVARLRLGVTTDTQDMTGQILSEKTIEEIRHALLSENDISEDEAQESPETDAAAVSDSGPGSFCDADRQCLEAIRAVSARFVGEISQIPPMYSAVWSNGQRLYDLARKGVTVAREPRTVSISELEIRSVDLPYVTMRVVCSKGTYIRTLCEDIGNALGTGGAMDHLIRTRVGSFTLEQALTLREVQLMMRQEEQVPCSIQGEGASGAMASAASAVSSRRCRLLIEDHIVPVDSFFAEDPAVHVRDEDLKYLLNGNPLSAANTLEGRLPHKERVRVYDARGEFYALYRWEKGRRRILPVKMFHDTESVRHDKR